MMRHRSAWSFATVLLILLTASVVGAKEAPLHPPFPLKDAAGQSVLVSGQPVSPMKTCAGCHDTDYIASHGFHGEEGIGRQWDPLTYSGRAARGAAGTAQHANRAFSVSARHVGGGTTTPGTDGALLELDCFLCHLRRPAYAERAQEIKSGRFLGAPTALLLGTGLVRRDGAGWRWNVEAFDESGRVDLTKLAAGGHRLGAPETANCGHCHGPTPVGPAPIMWKDLLGQKNAETRGQVFSAERLRDSALNLAGKDSLHRPFDIHAERLLVCSDCHHSPNNPIHGARAQVSRPRHLRFDARRPALAEFLRTPSHDFARGRGGSMKGCSDCHTTAGTHEWLPYVGTHLAALRCEACHVPHVHAPARRATDWTVLRAPGKPRVEYRGVNGPVDEAASLVTGFQPLLLPRIELDGTTRLMPYNVIAFWYWVESASQRPVDLALLERAFFTDGGYHADILAALEENLDGAVVAEELAVGIRELALDTPEMVAAVRARLQAVGVADPVIVGELRPYALHHTVTTGSFATRDCRACHADASRIAAPLPLAPFAPGGVLPSWAGDDRVRPTGAIRTAEDGHLSLVPDPEEGGRYILGHDNVAWIDTLGVLAVLLVLLGAGTHGLLRILTARRRRQV